MNVYNYSNLELALYGLEGVVGPYKDTEIAVACHRGMHRSKYAASILTSCGFPIANDFRSGNQPTLNYSDFVRSNFRVTSDGVSVQHKTILPFQTLVVFHDDSPKEFDQVKRLTGILNRAAGNVLENLLWVVAYDQDSLLSMS